VCGLSFKAKTNLPTSISHQVLGESKLGYHAVQDKYATVCFTLPPYLDGSTIYGQILMIFSTSSGGQGFNKANA
jgi:hypothetical protein